MTDITAELQRCAKCGKCRAVCPTFLVSRDETKVARGRISLLEAILEGRAIPTDYGREILMSCYGCMRCSEACPSGVRIDLIVRSAREMLAREMGLSRFARFVFRQVLPRRRMYDGAISAARFLQRFLRKSRSQPLRHLPLFFKGKRNIPRIAAKPALRRLPEIIKGRGDIKVSLFLGCMLNYVYPEIAASIMHILELHGVDIILPRSQLCCGTPVLAYGDMEAARALARRNVKCLEPDKVDAIVLGCASCELTMKRDYPVLLKGAEQFSKKIYDISEFIHDFLGYSNLALDERITYHDPCHLRWGRGVSQPPREILRQSCRFVEMERAGECCGLGGSFSLTHYDVSCALGKAKIDAVRESGADIVATACPGCILQLQDQLAQQQMKTPVMHVAQVYEMSYLKGRDFPGSPARETSKTLRE
jgi:glycolate oxidase iron-sulfur subunit